MTTPINGDNRIPPQQPNPETRRRKIMATLAEFHDELRALPIRDEMTDLMFDWHTHFTNRMRARDVDENLVFNHFSELLLEMIHDENQQLLPQEAHPAFPAAYKWLLAHKVLIPTPPAPAPEPQGPPNRRERFERLRNIQRERERAAAQESPNVQEHLGEVRNVFAQVETQATATDQQFRANLANIETQRNENATQTNRQIEEVTQGIKNLAMGIQLQTQGNQALKGDLQGAKAEVNKLRDSTKQLEDDIKKYKKNSLLKTGLTVAACVAAAYCGVKFIPTGNGVSVGFSW